MSDFTVIRDTREKAFGGWTFESMLIKKLDTADYSVEGLEDFVCIERKQTINEFAHNCVEKRWRTCMERMGQCKHAYLIFEFSWDDIENYPDSAKVPARVKRKLRIRPPLIKKMIQIAREQYGIHVLACGDILRAEKAAYRILKRAHELSLRR